MSHRIHHTKALVLGIKNIKEAHRMAILYTEDFGLLYVHAQSIRKQEAKMRYHLQQFSLVNVDLVQGRDIWRLTGIHELVSSLSFVETYWYEHIDHMTSIMIRLCQGEEPNELLWNEISHTYSMIQIKQEYYPEHELLGTIRILFSLGYWNSDTVLLEHSNPYSDEAVRMYIKNERRNLIQKINHALQHSQL